MVVRLEFFLCGVEQDSGCGGINSAICITNHIGLISRTVVKHDANNKETTYSTGSGEGGKGGRSSRE